MHFIWTSAMASVQILNIITAAAAGAPKNLLWHATHFSSSTTASQPAIHPKYGAQRRLIPPHCVYYIEICHLILALWEFIQHWVWLTDWLTESCPESCPSDSGLFNCRYKIYLSLLSTLNYYYINWSTDRCGAGVDRSNVANVPNNRSVSDSLASR